MTAAQYTIVLSLIYNVPPVILSTPITSMNMPWWLQPHGLCISMLLCAHKHQALMGAPVLLPDTAKLLTHLYW